MQPCQEATGPLPVVGMDFDQRCAKMAGAKFSDRCRLNPGFSLEASGMENPGQANLSY